MNKLRFYQFLVIGLIIANIIILAFMFFGRKNRPLHKGPRNIIIEKLHFSAEQSAEFDKLINAHQSNIQQKEREIKLVKNNIYSNLSNEPQDTASVDSLQASLSKLTYDIERIHYQHFLDVKALCRPEQLPAYKELTREMAMLFSLPMLNERKRKP